MPSAKRFVKPAKKRQPRSAKPLVSGSQEQLSDPFAPATEAAETINAAIDTMETYVKHRIECWVCTKVETDRDVSEVQFARDLYRCGWRYITSEVFQTSGVACPECVAMPDKERAEL